MLGVKLEDTILDVGGVQNTWEGTSVENQVTILNLMPVPEEDMHITWIQGDARDMKMIGDKSFDIVFSNSVIEHVGDFQSQEKMAKEVRRVGKKYWEQTPYKHFPLEIHFLFPLFQYLPRPFAITVARFWPFSYAKLFHLDPVAEAKSISLLNRTEFQRLFPDATIVKEKFLGFTKSLVAVRQ